MKKRIVVLQVFTQNVIIQQKFHKNFKKIIATCDKKFVLIINDIENITIKHHVLQIYNFGNRVIWLTLLSKIA